MNNSQRFDSIRDTPHKKVKLNESSTNSHSKTNSNKTSFFDRLKMGHRANKTESYNSIPVQISQFQLPLQYKSSRSSIEEQMQEQSANKQIVSKLMLNRQFTCRIRDEQQEMLLNTLNLYRNNSTCEQTRKKQEINLGDNIYLRRLNSKVDYMNIRTDYGSSQHKLRIQQDYEIQTNLKLTTRHHESYICLNKLERIFYYVKKIIMNWEEYQNYEFLQSLIAQQIKIYHNDSNDHFLRFYQEWFQQNALYLTFEVAIESLADANLVRNRFREIQVWDLLRDITSSLKWLKQSQQMAHLNIKPGNIIKCQNKFKLVDPYCSEHILKHYLQRLKQNWNGWQYLAPQIKNFSFLLDGLNFSQADIYALGICIIENLLAEKYFPLEGKALRNYIQKHLHGYSPSLIRVLMRMVSLDPEKRPRAEELCAINKKQSGEAFKPRRRFSI